MRVGLGFDIHRTDSQRKLILAGVEIPAEFGLAGHSDADVLCHALIDALLGAAGLGDIGELFPDTDPAYKDADSMELLEQVCQKISEQGFRLVNADCNVIAQKPKLKDYKKQMEDNLAKALQVSASCVNVKAKTHEKLGELGRCMAIEAQAVVLLKGCK